MKNAQKTRSFLKRRYVSASLHTNVWKIVFESLFFLKIRNCPGRRYRLHLVSSFGHTEYRSVKVFVPSPAQTNVAYTIIGCMNGDCLQEAVVTYWWDELRARIVARQVHLNRFQRLYSTLLPRKSSIDITAEAWVGRADHKDWTWSRCSKGYFQKPNVL